MHQLTKKWKDEVLEISLEKKIFLKFFVNNFGIS
jgi:hypothetical protein